MLTNKEHWLIERLRLRGNSIRGISRITGHNRETIARVVKSPSPESSRTSSGQTLVPTSPSGRKSLLEPFKPFIREQIDQRVSKQHLVSGLRNRGYAGSEQALRMCLRSMKCKTTPTSRLNTEWMHWVLQGIASTAQLIKEIPEGLTAEEVAGLLEVIIKKGLKARNRALTVLAHHKGIPSRSIATFLCVNRGTIRHYLSDYETGSITSVLVRTRPNLKKTTDPKYTDAVFRTLHQPPRSFGFNRTTWRMEDLHLILSKQGFGLCCANIRTIIKNAGYKFRKAKKVLTSTDPEYREKLAKITALLANLKPDEKFFSIDEFGPFAVKIIGGRSWSKADQLKTVPQLQRSKGSLIATAALELSTNQITHFFSDKKNTVEMIRLLELLVDQYRGQSRIFLSWDAASWHGSKKFFARVEEINQRANQAPDGSPLIALAPLPACAQFLNVIESVFSGMARAIIHNSDYGSVSAAKDAIDQYFAERNEHFLKHPRRAGNKLWGKERVEPEFSAAHNCKDPKW